ncbi:hypothetical protein [[Limnothrix rosea] IAM M-220]|nr:hypothetical protein [[Limnothrix rosea] IAM M-220]
MMDLEIRGVIDGDLPQILELAIAAFGEEGSEITALINLSFA